MSQISIVTKFLRCSNLDELTLSDQKLLQAAHSAVAQSYSPYSNFKVGAALLTADGNTILGSNQENASYPLCLCAERTALAAASSIAPNIPIIAMAVTAKNPKIIISQPISPCGACRQVLCEAEQRGQTNLKIILQGEVGDIFIFESARDLLPFFFDATFL